MDKVPEYRFLDLEAKADETCPIEILSGEFEGVVYKYGKISLEELESGDLKVNMQVDVIDSFEGFNQENENFTKIVGEIFVNLIERGANVKSEPTDLEDDVHQD
jgi:hypothetical protein